MDLVGYNQYIVTLHMATAMPLHSVLHIGLTQRKQFIDLKSGDHGNLKIRDLPSRILYRSFAKVCPYVFNLSWSHCSKYFALGGQAICISRCCSVLQTWRTGSDRVRWQTTGITGTCEYLKKFWASHILKLQCVTFYLFCFLQTQHTSAIPTTMPLTLSTAVQNKTICQNIK